VVGHFGDGSLSCGTGSADREYQGDHRRHVLTPAATAPPKPLTTTSISAGCEKKGQATLRHASRARQVSAWRAWKSVSRCAKRSGRCTCGPCPVLGTTASSAFGNSRYIAMATGSWFVFSFAFAFVLNKFGGCLVDPLYGWFTGVIAVLLYVYWSAYILLLGAEVNHAIEVQSRFARDRRCFHYEARRQP
jgi:Virulence factor BrkB